MTNRASWNVACSYGEHDFEIRENHRVCRRCGAIYGPVTTTSDSGEHYPGEPTPASMIRDLQRAVFGASYASSRSPADEWLYLLQIVQDSVPTMPWKDTR